MALKPKRKRPERRLDDTAKAYIVHALAMFDTPTMVSKSLKEDLGVDASPQLVESYNPTKRAGRNLSDKWKTMFEEARKAFLEDASSIPIANRSARLRALQRMATKAEHMGNMAMVSKLLEQAAKEMGNAFTNKIDLQSSDGTMSPPSLNDFYGGLRKAQEGNADG
ncbi:DUF2280 domain-containing protein [Novosphingobium resinovorum]|uniref:DUF2280 domain-containing protein n=1 Tax=Novosphingobium resinovorum TaxID=158500 RepID=A0A1D8A2J4_9SPHN|nr:DUF2280 domain-containing protein [Novosphingobium resinovorum]AOR76329.1 hypothetical protein BES08_05805 [Novosphingobium resinovorum]